MRKVTLYGRPGCHLCDEARELLERIRADVGTFAVEEVDIDRDQLLLKRYLERIPVIVVDGVAVSELVPDESVIRASLDTVGT